MTKREIGLVCCTFLIMCLPLAIIAHKRDKVPLKSTAFDWKTIKAEATASGERRSFFDAPTTTLEDMECHATILNAGESAHPPHQHPEEELIIVKEGTVEVLVGGELKRVGRGSVIFQAANSLHSIKNVGTGQAVYHAIKWRSTKTGKAVASGQ